MLNQTAQNDTAESLLIEMLELKHRLCFMSKIQVSNGEQVRKDELSAVFSSFSKDLGKIISTYQNTL